MKIRAFVAFIVVLTLGLSVARPAAADSTSSLVLVAPLTISPASPEASDAVTASFTVENTGTGPLEVPYLVAAARDANGRNVDFPGVALMGDRALQPGQQYRYEQSRPSQPDPTLYYERLEPGHYTVSPAYLDGATGDWVALGATTSFSVSEACALPRAGGRFLAEEPLTSLMIKIRTGNVDNAGTNDLVFFRFSDQRAKTPLVKRGIDNFERGSLTEYMLDPSILGGLKVQDIEYLQLEKDVDNKGPLEKSLGGTGKQASGGGWDLGGIEVYVNGKLFHHEDPVSAWGGVRSADGAWLMEEDRRWLAGEFVPCGPQFTTRRVTVRLDSVVSRDTEDVSGPDEFYLWGGAAASNGAVGINGVPYKGIVIDPRSVNDDGALHSLGNVLVFDHTLPAKEKVQVAVEAVDQDLARSWSNYKGDVQALADATADGLTALGGKWASAAPVVKKGVPALLGLFAGLDADDPLGEAELHIPVIGPTEEYVVGERIKGRNTWYYSDWDYTVYFRVTRQAWTTR